MGGGYAGADNRLYRVEIHEGGGEPTFKWSRDNGSTTAAVRSTTPTEIALARANEPEFRDGDLLEVIDRNTTLERRPGPFVQVERVDGDRLVLTPGSEPVPHDLIRPIVRRWDGGRQFVRPGTADPIALDDGLEVRFEGSRFRSGDYWLITARAGDRSLTWPDATNAADPRPPHGVEVHRCPIAAVRRDASGWIVRRDLRSVVPGQGRR